MALLWHTKTGQQATVPDDQVAQAIASGDYGFRKDEKVALINRAGKAVEVDGVNAFAALNDGYRVETADETQARLDRQKYGESVGAEIAAGAAGVARGVTIGLSDLALTKSGAVDPETLQKLREYNPAASTGGEVAGVLGSLLLPGGAVGTVAKGAKGATSVVRGVSAAGQATERLVARAIATEGAQGVARQIVGRVLPKVAGSAVEGAFYGSGQEITESALGDTELTAERLLAGAGMGAMIGGGAAGAFGLGGVALEAGVRGAGKALSSTAKAIGRLYENATGSQAHPKLGELWAKASSVVSGADEKTIGLFMRGNGIGARARAAGVMADDAVDDIAAKLTRDADELEGIYSKAIDLGRGEAKANAFGELVQGVDPDTVSARSGNAVAAVRANLDNMIATTEDYGFRRQVKLGLQAVKRADDDLSAAATPGAKFIAVDRLKRDLGHLRVQMRKSVTSADQATQSEFATAYETLRQHLEDASTYGAKAAETQRAVNAGWSELLNPKNYRNNFYVRFGQDEFADIYRANPEKFRQFVNGLGTSRANLDDEWIAGQVAGKKRMLDLFERYYDIPAESLEGFRTARDAADRFASTLSGARESLTLRNQLHELDKVTNALSGMGVLGAGAVGYAVGDEMGGGVGLALGALMAPGKMVRQLAALERISGAVRGKVETSLSTWAKRATESVTKVAAASERKAARLLGPASVAIANSADEREKRRERRADYERQIARIDRFASDPEHATRTLAAGTDKLRAVAPQVAQAAQARATTAVEFLRSKAPRPPSPVGMLAQKWKPSDSQVEKWNRYVRAVERPLSVLDDLSKGNLTLEAVEALRTVYPKMHEDLVGGVMGHIGELQKTLPYRERRQLSILLGVPVDPTTDPAFVAAMQDGYASLVQQQAQGQGTPMGGGKTARKVDFTLGETSETKAQRLANK